MQKKPDGETRNPTDIWSGMGFSKSMPESVIRERMQRIQGVLAYCEPTMETTYENPNESEELDLDSWNDTSVATINKPMNLAPGEFPSPRKKCDYNDYLSSSNHVDSATLPPAASFWDTDHADLPELFSKLGLGKYSDLFRQQEIDLATFLTLTEKDLRELGITTFGARRKMLLAIADLNKRRSLLATEKGVENVTTDRGFTDNGTTTNLRMDSQSSTGSHMLEHLSSSLGNGPFSHPRSLMSSYTSPLNHGGRYPLKGQFLSHSARLSESRNTSQNAHMMRGSGLSGSFNYTSVDSLFPGDRLVKAPPGFPPRKISLNQSASGNLFASSELYSHQIDFNTHRDASSQNFQPDCVNLSGRW